MNQTAVISLARQLANAVLAGDEKSARILAADLDAAWKEQQTLKPWTPWSQRASIIAHSPGCAE